MDRSRRQPYANATDHSSRHFQIEFTLIARSDNSSHWNGGKDNVFADERSLIDPYNCCYYLAEDQTLVASDCPYQNDSSSACYQKTDDASNGGVCYCDEDSQDPSTACAYFSASSSESRSSAVGASDTVATGCSLDSTLENLVVFNGSNDFYIEALYGQMLATDYGGDSTNKYYIESDSLSTTNDGASGHGTPMQYPAAFQDVIYDFVSGKSGDYSQYKVN